MQSVDGVTLKQSSQANDKLWAVPFTRSRVFCIHLLALKKKEFDQWGVEKLFQNPDEVIITELKMYIEDREKLNTIFLAEYVSLDLYDIDL